MRVRSLLAGTALVSSVLGAIVVYLVMSVPNDLQAGSLLKQARAHIAGGRNAQAHDSLTQIIQRYPRTDAAAAATVALVKLEEQERQRMQAELTRLKTVQEAQAKQVGDLQKSIATLRTTRPPATVTAPPAKAATTATKTTAKKTTTKKAPAKKRPAKKSPAKRKKR